MTRFFYIVFFSFLVLGISCIVAAFFLNSVPNPFQTLSEHPIQIESANVKEVPLEKQIEKSTTNQIHVVRVCQGEIVRPVPVIVEAPKEEEKQLDLNVDDEQIATTFHATLDILDREPETKTTEGSQAIADNKQEPESKPASLKRTYIFLAAEDGVPEIITAKVIRTNESTAEVSTVSIADANQPMIAEHGLRAEHGTLTQLKDLDYARQQSRYSELMNDAKNLCFDATQNSEREQNDKMEFLKTQATAYIQLDLDLDAANSKVLIFYQVNGFIHQQEALLTDRPI